MNGSGGRLGPDLSRIGVARARAAMARQIRGAVERLQDRVRAGDADHARRRSRSAA